VDARAKKGQSPEASARTARYQAFSQLLDDNEYLLTAQHLDDQAETLLLQLLRGSGTKGLSAMPRVKPFSKGYLCRPILDYKKQDILDYAKRHQLEWIEDESNQEQRFDRNYLRQTILPLLEKRWPAVKENFAKSAEVLAESQLLLDNVADGDIQTLYYINLEGITEHNKLLLEPTLKFLEYSEHDSGSPCGSHINNQAQARLNNLLRHWINLNHLPMPSKKILEQIVHSVILAREDAMPLVTWRRDAFHCEVRRYRDKLYLLDVSFSGRENDNKQSYILSVGQAVILKNSNTCIKLSSDNQTIEQNSFDRQKLLTQPVTVRFRKGGERYRKYVGDHSHPLKHWFQEQGIPPWEREQMPLIFWGEELIQIGHHIVNDSLKPSLKKTNKKSSENALNSSLKINESDDLLSIHWQRIENK
jgi:tRNA(Ile)-lysidine synthase